MPEEVYLQNGTTVEDPASLGVVWVESLVGGKSKIPDGRWEETELRE